MINYTPPTRHTSLFYNSREEYLDIILPYFAAGLENNEFCLWNLPKDFKSEDAQKIINDYTRDNNIWMPPDQFCIKDYDQFYLKDGIFSADRVLQAYGNLEKEVLQKGFKGIRVTGDGTWALENNWLDILMYENQINRLIHEYEIRAMCSYYIPRMDLKEICDIGSSHQSSLVKQMGNWTRLDSSKFMQADIY